MLRKLYESPVRRRGVRDRKGKGNALGEKPALKREAGKPKKEIDRITWPLYLTNRLNTRWLWTD